MSNPLKQLAGETAIYGMSTILARIVNFLLVPLYTRVLLQSDYGVVTEFMAYIAILQVVLTLGLETGCFRFASREGVDTNKVFSNAFMTVLAICSVFLIAISLFSGDISSALGYDGFGKVIIYVGAILLIDNTTAIIFARLRYEHKALKFAVIKTLKIFTEVGANLLLYLVMPARFAANPDHWLLNFVSATPDFTYAIFAIFVSCLLCLVLLLPDICALRFRYDGKLWKELLLYSIPLMIAGLPGVLNDFLDRVLMRFLNADPAMWRADLGVYQAGVKIAVIMSLFIQMFRYAAEPFFFQRQKDKGSKELYAKVMNYFVAFCMFAFLFVMLYMDEIGLLLGKNFRAGLSIAPVMLMAYVMLGMLFNVNMWYKLSGKTGFAIWVTLAGLVVTIVVNVLFMPRFSYHAAAWGHLASYAVMLLISTLLGNKYYRIPYRWGMIAAFIGLGLGIWALSMVLPQMSMWPKLGVHTLLIIVYIVCAGALILLTNKRKTNESANCQ
ncbi:MAG: oligosaccharide flippase family protein [Bacteroidales bacterium]|nr:oligosaccharide flippase family protein [Bacteroidales bacterium]